MKPTLPYGQLPILEVEDDDGNKNVVGQSSAILRFVGKMGADLYPADPIQAMAVDSVYYAVEDACKGIGLTVAGAVRSFISEKDWTKEEVLAMRKRLIHPEMPNSMPFVSIFPQINLS